MQVSPVNVVNLALQRIGAKGTISSLTENSPNAVRANIAWTMIFPMVLSERDWIFAKTKVNLQQSALRPVFGYYYAYTLPSDFLRLVRPKEKPQEEHIVIADQYGYGQSTGGGPNSFGRISQSDVPVWPRQVAPYVVQTIANTANPNNITYQLYLLTNYNSTQSTQSQPPNTWPIPVGITYIRFITDMTVCTPGFIDALTYRMAAELAIAVTEDSKKQQTMMGMYNATLNGAQAQTECDDSLKDEAGSMTWVNAGRHVGYY